MKTQQKLEAIRKWVITSIHGCEYEEALEKELGFGCKVVHECEKLTIIDSFSFCGGIAFTAMDDLHDVQMDGEYECARPNVFDVSDKTEIMGCSITIGRLMAAMREEIKVQPIKESLFLGLEELGGKIRRIGRKQYAGVKIGRQKLSYYTYECRLGGNYCYAYSEEGERTQKAFNELLFKHYLESILKHWQLLRPDGSEATLEDQSIETIEKLLKLLTN